MVDTFLFPSRKRLQRSNVLHDFTVRDFSGGWNVADNDLNLSSKFSKVLSNMQRSTDNGIEIRPGTKLFADCSIYLDEITNMEFYNNNIIVVGKNGVIVRVANTGQVDLIWDTETASKLPGAPLGWSETVFCSFAQFNGELIICNGIDKPLLVNQNLFVTYLNDIPDTTNVNTPICKYVVAHARYLVMGGDPDAPSTIYISNTDTSGTWVGDNAPNDAVNIDLGSRVPIGSDTIKGIGQFRDKLAVYFEEAVLPGTLGVYSGSDHAPTFDDAIEEHGSISHRVVKTIGENMLFCDQNGLSSITRAAFTGDIKPERVSHFVDPELQNDLDGLTSTDTLEQRTWAIYDSQSFNYMLFIPNNDDKGSTTAYKTYVLKSNKTQKIHAWQQYNNWNFTCGCRSNIKKMYFGQGTQVFIMGDIHAKSTEQLYKDYEGDQEMFSDDTSFTDYYGWTPVADVADSGVPIPFEWELPWADYGQRFMVKNSRHINFDTIGTQGFTVQMFIDNIYYDRSDFGEDWWEDTLKFDDGTGWDVDVLNPALEMSFTGGESFGLGGVGYGQPLAGTRPTSLEQLYAWVTKFKIAKLRMSGDGIEPLKYVSITNSYQMGSIRR